jgi:hypothetical protein
MRAKELTTAIGFSVLAIMLISVFVAAQGAVCQPNRFKGSATVNGVPAPTGLEVVAKINGAEMGRAITVDGRYGDVPYKLDVSDNDNNCGNAATVEFFIQGQPAGTSSFANGVLTYLDLSATGVMWCGDGSCNNGETCETCPADCGTCSSGNGGGGGGGGGGYTPPVCTPDWECSSWSQCIDGTQTRECLDVNECDSEEGKPAEEQSCGIESVLPSDCTEGQTTCVGDDLFECGAGSKWREIETCEFGCASGACLEESAMQQQAGAPFTGMFLDPVTALYTLVILIILALTGTVFWRSRKGLNKAGDFAPKA